MTIDLALFKQVQVSPDHKLASIGPGNRWSEVYSRLEPLGLAVSGGRWGNVGVGGLLTGGKVSKRLYIATTYLKTGGLSFFQGREGLACDGVLNHEVCVSNSYSSLLTYLGRSVGRVDRKRQCDPLP